MDSPIKIFILGSCVSRDPFEFADKKDFNVVAYYARSSFASLGAKPYVDERLLSEIRSNWQRRMLHADMEKSVFEQLKRVDYDILLIDLVDERFNLNSIDGSLHTVSSEYRKAALCQKSRMNIVPAFSERKFAFWVEGVDKFFSAINELGILYRVVVNQVYYAKSVDRIDGSKNSIGIWSKEKIDKANQELGDMYDYLATYLDEDSFLSYPSSLIYADSTHKWNLAPFHFNRDFQLHQVRRLLEMSREFSG